MIPILEFGFTYYKSRRRFNRLINEAKFPLKIIFKRLKNGDKTLRDDEIITTYQTFSETLQSNAYAIAQLELAIVSVLCAARPNLTEKLLERPFLAIIACLGDHANYEGVTGFIDNYLLRRNVKRYGGLPPKAGTDWLKKLKENRKIIETVLTRMWIQNEKELNEG